MFEFDVIITSEYVDWETISKKTEKGWTFVTILPAKTIHPNALETDKATIFSKYVSRSEPDIFTEATLKEAE
ncbi:hypothetical protein MOE67_13735 [Bacillus inaquosorum]|uniref:hypothetical protein n=1 Tax=Bacillus inaquosorum TaxID=483913 RepID=UPI00227EB2A8|nr:hypothetical protein [Bacillus inaquosorum]MCY9063256.1 hypothetical protein [Bacillus inaquosorum]